MGSWLQPVEEALEAARAPVRVFFRDDDAGWGDARLRVLLDVFAAHELPVDLAVIPLELEAGLARELAARPGVGLHQHGLAHANHEREGRKCEFGPSRGLDAQRRDIEAGHARLTDLLRDRVDPIFTPPWNRCTIDTGTALAELGFRVLSRESRADPLGVPDLHELPIHIDWVRLSPLDLGVRIAGAIEAGGPVGLMFHHAVMEDMHRMSDLLSLLAGHERVRAERMIELARASVV
jgi:peptidoglycan/xylan/chitin deacetylase (PgdA/CDA1 family)